MSVLADLDLAFNIDGGTGLWEPRTSRFPTDGLFSRNEVASYGTFM